MKVRELMTGEEGNAWIAFAIIIAGLLVAVAVIFTGKDERVPSDIAFEPTVSDEEPDPSIITPVTEADYMLGDINAPIKIVEYSDIECPFCKRLHDTLHQLIEEYPGQIAWVYRHMPIVSSYPKAFVQAVAVECAAEQNGNDGYWAMLDRIYDETPGNNRFDLSKLPEFAADQGLNVDEFNECIDSGRFDDKVKAQTAEGFAAGAQGTPFSVIITPEGNHIPVSGAQPINVWRQIVEQILEAEVSGEAEVSAEAEVEVGADVNN